MYSSIKVIEKDADFDGEVLKCPIPAIVHFRATWCGPCKALDPIIEKIGQEFQGKVKVCAVDIDDCPEVAKMYGVKTVPTVIVFKSGQKVAAHAGLASQETILKLAGL